MLRRFFYFPTPTFEGCETDLNPVAFDDCNPIIKLSEIRRIFMGKAIAAPFDDWTDAEEWEARLDNLTTAGDDYLRTLVVIGDKPAPTPVTKDISNNRRLTISKTHVINFTIDEVTPENHEFMRQLEAGGQVKIWYETHGGLMFGGNDGIKTSVRIDMLLPRGPEEIMTYAGVLEWKNQFTEERIDSPIFDNFESTVGTFDTTLDFVSDTDDTAGGVTATIAANDPTMKLQFNIITPQVGTPQSMEIVLSGISQMTVDYPTDYNGASFKFIDQGNNAHYGVFTNGIVNF